MQLICLSLSHQNTPVELRECVSLSPETIQQGMTECPIRKAQFEALAELVVLSTCNRLEAYGLVTSPEGEDAPDEAARLVQDYLRDALRVSTAQIGVYIQQYAGGQAVRHLFQVASGLDSIAIGETQILGQVSRALDAALQSGNARHVLSSLFRAAIHTGKRTRTETEIGRHPTSLSQVGVQLAEQRLGSLRERTVLVIGAGKMGGLAIEALQGTGAGRITLTNRTLRHAETVAGKMGVGVLAYEDLYTGLEEADLIFTSAAAPLPILCHDAVARAMERRANRPLAIVDLAVPRNTEPLVKEIPNVMVFDMDDLQVFAQSAMSGSRQEMARAQAIVEEEVAEYEKLLRVIPFIGELHKKVEDIRQREVEKTLRHLHDSPLEVAEQIEQLSRSLVRKVLHEPTMHLRTETNQETLNDYVDTLAKLFDLEESRPDFLAKDQQWEP